MDVQQHIAEQLEDHYSGKKEMPEKRLLSMQKRMDTYQTQIDEYARKLSNRVSAELQSCSFCGVNPVE